MTRLRHRSGPTARTTAGPIRGTTSSDGRIAHFRAIPYAAPPVGDLRWRPPQPPEAWTDERHCTKFGPYAHQRNFVFEQFFDLIIAGLGLGPVRRRALTAATKLARVKESEDCLTLNVRRTRATRPGCR